MCGNITTDTDYLLTASDEEVNIIRGLDCGGDDYVTKPFKLGNYVPVFVPCYDVQE